MVTEIWASGVDLAYQENMFFPYARRYGFFKTEDSFHLSFVKGHLRGVALGMLTKPQVIVMFYNIATPDSRKNCLHINQYRDSHFREIERKHPDVNIVMIGIKDATVEVNGGERCRICNEIATHESYVADRCRHAQYVKRFDNCYGYAEV